MATSNVNNITTIQKDIKIDSWTQKDFENRMSPKANLSLIDKIVAYIKVYGFRTWDFLTTGKWNNDQALMKRLIDQSKNSNAADANIQKIMKDICTLLTDRIPSLTQEQQEFKNKLFGEPSPSSSPSVSKPKAPIAPSNTDLEAKPKTPKPKAEIDLKPEPQTEKAKPKTDPKLQPEPQTGKAKPKTDPKLQPETGSKAKPSVTTPVTAETAKLEAATKIQALIRANAAGSQTKKVAAEVKKTTQETAAALQIQALVRAASAFASTPPKKTTKPEQPKQPEQPPATNPSLPPSSSNPASDLDPQEILNQKAQKAFHALLKSNQEQGLVQKHAEVENLTRAVAKQGKQLSSPEGIAKYFELLVEVHEENFKLEKDVKAYFELPEDQRGALKKEDLTVNFSTMPQQEDCITDLNRRLLEEYEKSKNIEILSLLHQTLSKYALMRKTKFTEELMKVIDRHCWAVALAIRDVMVEDGYTMDSAKNNVATAIDELATKWTDKEFNKYSSNGYNPSPVNSAYNKLYNFTKKEDAPPRIALASKTYTKKLIEMETDQYSVLISWLLALTSFNVLPENDDPKQYNSIKEAISKNWLKTE